MFWRFRYPAGGQSTAQFRTQQEARDAAVYSKSRMKPQKWHRTSRDERDLLWASLERSGYRIEVAQ